MYFFTNFRKKQYLGKEQYSNYAEDPNKQKGTLGNLYCW